MAQIGTGIFSRMRSDSFSLYLTTFPMSLNRRIFLSIIATCGRSLYALVCGLFISRWVLAALGKTDFGVCGVAGGMIAIELLAGKMRLDRGGIAAVGIVPMMKGA